MKRDDRRRRGRATARSLAVCDRRAAAVRVGATLLSRWTNPPCASSSPSRRTSRISTMRRSGRCRRARTRRWRDSRAISAISGRCIGESGTPSTSICATSAARLIGAEPGEIAILKNTSEGLSFVAEGFRWEAGDNVVTTDLEFPSNSTPWRKLDRRGVDVRVVRSHDGAFTVDDVERCIDERTRIVTVSGGRVPQRLRGRSRRHRRAVCARATSSSASTPFRPSAFCRWT